MPKPQPSAYPECRHILTNGRKCHSPALTGRPFCHSHARLRNYTGRNQRSINSVELPPLEDHSAILIALDQVVFSLTHGRITDKLAGRLFLRHPARTELHQAPRDPRARRAGHRLRRRQLRRPGRPAEPGSGSSSKSGSKSSSESSAKPSVDHDDFPLLSAHAKTHSGRGDTCWEPTNADYPDHPAEPVAKPATTPPERSAANTAREISPEGTRDNSPGRKSRDTDAHPEAPEGRPNPNPPKPGSQKSGPWDNPLLDHIVHQLQSGISERELAAQLTRDIQANKFV